MTLKIFKKIHLLSILIICFILVSCSQVSILNKAPEDIYSPAFLSKLKLARSYLAKKNYNQAITVINSQATSLSEAEQAMKSNFLGVIYFSQGGYQKALIQFNRAYQSANKAGEDQNLKNQVLLNLSSVYFKLNDREKSLSKHNEINKEALSANELKKYSLLGIKLYESQFRENSSTENRRYMGFLFDYLASYKNISSLKQNSYFPAAKNLFSSFNYTEQTSILREYEDKPSLAIGLIAYDQVDKLYDGGERENAKNLLSYLKAYFDENQQLSKLLNSHRFIAEKFSQMNPLKIGVVLPLSGTKGSFGQRALLGIDYAHGSIQAKQKLLIRDSKSSGAVGSFHVRELIEKHKVAFIIGGLFPEEALSEYREAKKYGAFFISLSPIYLENRLKTSLLLEIPGSVESQVSSLFSKLNVDNLGPRGSILYPDDQEGQAYIESFWQESKASNQIGLNVGSFKKNVTDYREPVKKILGLAYPRLRQEEYNLMSSIHSLKKKGNIRRIQTLKPIIDFDWVFIPSNPREALQIVPSFRYYDARNVRVIGPPRWRSALLLRESNSSNMYFIDDDLDLDKNGFKLGFQEKYSRQPRILEARGYDSFMLGSSLLKSLDVSNRFKFHESLMEVEEISGLTGQWNQVDKKWLKEMSLYSIKRGKIEQMY